MFFFTLRRVEKNIFDPSWIRSLGTQKNLPLVIVEDLFVVEGNQLLELIFQRKSAKKRFWFQKFRAARAVTKQYINFKASSFTVLSS